MLHHHPHSAVNLLWHFWSSTLIAFNTSIFQFFVPLNFELLRCLPSKRQRWSPPPGPGLVSEQQCLRANLAEVDIPNAFSRWDLQSGCFLPLTQTGTGSWTQMKSWATSTPTRCSKKLWPIPTWTQGWWEWRKGNNGTKVMIIIFTIAGSYVSTLLWKRATSTPTGGLTFRSFQGFLTRPICLRIKVISINLIMYL